MRWKAWKNLWKLLWNYAEVVSKLFLVRSWFLPGANCIEERLGGGVVNQCNYAPLAARVKAFPLRVPHWMPAQCPSQCPSLPGCPFARCRCRADPRLTNCAQVSGNEMQILCGIRDHVLAKLSPSLSTSPGWQLSVSVHAPLTSPRGLRISCIIEIYKNALIYRIYPRAHHKPHM